RGPTADRRVRGPARAGAAGARARGWLEREPGTDTGPRLAKRGAGSTTARGPAELLRGTWAFQLWHLTERRCWCSRRHVTGKLEGATDSPDRTTSRLQSSNCHWTPSGAPNGSLRSSSVLVARSSWCEVQCMG